MRELPRQLQLEDRARIVPGTGNLKVENNDPVDLDESYQIIEIAAFTVFHEDVEIP